MTETKVTPPWHLWVVGAIAVLFNAIGVFDFVMYMTQGSSYLASAGMTPAQIAHYDAMAMWATGVWAIGVFGAMLASVFLLMRNRLAYPVFATSLAAFLVNLLYTYILTDGGEVMGRQMAVASTVIAGLLVLFAWYSRAMARKGVLRPT